MLSFTTLVVTDAEAQNYISDRNYDGWPDDSVGQLAALRRGQDYVAREYNQRWLTIFDGLLLPVPEVVKYAIIEAALAEARKPGILSPTVKASDAKMLTNVKGIQWTPITGPSGVEALRPRLLHVEAMLRPFTRTRPLFLSRM